jgi:hypothetical protein
MQKRNMQSFVPPKATAFGTGSVERGAVSQSQDIPPDQDIQSNVSSAPSPDEMSQAKRLGLTYYGFGRYGTTIKGKHTVTYLSKNGRLIQKPQQVAEEKKMKGADPCWKGYQMVGKKKKNGKEVPNCVPVDEAFEEMMNENKPSDREWGKPSLTKIYADDTPGSTARLNPLSEKKKMVRKKKVEEDAPPPYGYEFGNNGVGPTFGVVRSPGGFGMGYSLPMNESLQKWMNNEKTIERFISKYGELAEQKLYEAASKLDQVFKQTDGTPKLFTHMREAFDKGVGTMGTVPQTNNKGEVDESSKEDIVKPSKSLKGYKKLIHPQSDFEKETFKEESPAWQRKEGKNPTGGLNKKGIASYRRENPGSKLSLAVTTKPSKLKPGSKSAKRRKSFCARMGGMPGPMKDEKGRPTRKALSLRKWNCEE